MDQEIDEVEIPMPFKQCAKSYGYPSTGALRKMHFERKTNGLDAAFIKSHGRCLVLPKTLFKLIVQHGKDNG